MTHSQDDNLIRLMLQPPPPVVVDDTATKKLARLCRYRKGRYLRDQRRKQSNR